MIRKRAGKHTPYKAALAALMLLAVLTLHPGQGRAGDPEWTAFGSLLLPGLGQWINGDYVEGTAMFGIYAAAANRYNLLTQEEAYIEPQDRDDEETHTIAINRTTYAADLYGTILNTTSFYSSFAAYRDARRDKQGEYETKNPEESLGDLVLAPFDWEFLSRPSSFIPLLVPLYFAFTPAKEEYWVYLPDNSISRNELRRGFFVQHEMVALGEEAFFRGVLNNGLIDW